MSELPPSRSANGRSADLDVLKTLLVWGMIVAHCIQLLAFRPGPVAQAISTFINLVSFSAFMFAFGYGVGLSRREKSWAQRLVPVLLLLLATWTSEIAFSALVDKKPPDADLLVPLLSLSRLYGWSEFLASFCVLYLIIAVARPWLVRVATTPWLLVVAVLACLASTWVVVSVDLPLLATIVGTTRFASFPLLAYLPWFLIGIAFGRAPGRPNWLDWGLAIIATGAWSFAVWHYGGELPGRFPPSVLWVVGAALPILIYLILSRAIAPIVPAVLLGPGRHVLASLLLSNLAIFALRWLIGFRLGAWWWTPIFAISLIAAATAWAWLLDRARRPARSPSLAS